MSLPFTKSDNKQNSSKNETTNKNQEFRTNETSQLKFLQEQIEKNKKNEEKTIEIKPERQDPQQEVLAPIPLNTSVIKLD